MSDSSNGNVWGDASGPFASRSGNGNRNIPAPISAPWASGNNTSPTKPRSFYDTPSGPLSAGSTTFNGNSSHRNSRDGLIDNNISGNPYGAVGHDVRGSRNGSIAGLPSGASSRVDDLASGSDFDDSSYLQGSSHMYNNRLSLSLANLESANSVSSPIGGPNDTLYSAHSHSHTSHTPWTNPNFVNNIKKQSEMAADGFPPGTMQAQRNFVNQSSDRQSPTSSQGFASFTGPSAADWSVAGRNKLPSSVELLAKNLSYMSVGQMPQPPHGSTAQGLGMFNTGLDFHQQTALQQMQAGMALNDMAKMQMYNMSLGNSFAPMPGMNPYNHYMQPIAGFPLGNGMSDYNMRAAMNPSAMPTVNSAVPVVQQAPARSSMSSLLQEFQNNKHSNVQYELKAIYGHVVEFTGDQNGSRFIQEKLAQANSDEKEQLFKEIEPNALPIMRDLFGNYVIQKFFDHGSQAQKKVLGELMIGRVVDLSLNSYACRVVQKALEQVLVDQRSKFIKEIKENVMRLVTDTHGNHVVQKAIEVSPPEEMRFLMETFRGKFYNLSIDQYVCRVVQRMLEKTLPEDKRIILDEIHDSASRLIVNQYGNYVIQHVIRCGEPEDGTKMMDLVMSQLIILSKHKYASNVVETCIKTGDNETRTRILDTMRSVVDNKPQLPVLMKDSYGNYVIQTLLMHLPPSEQRTFASELRSYMSSLGAALAPKQQKALENKLKDLSIALTDGDSTPALTPDLSTPRDGGSQRNSPKSTKAMANGTLQKLIEVNP